MIGAAIISSKADPPSPLTREMLHSDEWGVAWVSWAPQTAILAHPLTRAFVSHGGQVGTEPAAHPLEHHASRSPIASGSGIYAVRQLAPYPSLPGWNVLFVLSPLNPLVHPRRKLSH